MSNDVNSSVYHEGVYNSELNKERLQIDNTMQVSFNIKIFAWQKEYNKLIYSTVVTGWKK